MLDTNSKSSSAEIEGCDTGFDDKVVVENADDDDPTEIGLTFAMGDAKIL